MKIIDAEKFLKTLDENFDDICKYWGECPAAEAVNAIMNAAKSSIVEATNISYLEGEYNERD